MSCFIDIETFSAEPIKNGTFRYAESAELLMVAWAIDDGPVEIWDTFEQPDIPEGLEEILLGDEILIAHNSIFESSVLAKTLQGVDIDPKRWRCTMAQAYAHGLPGSLDNLGIVLGMPQDKKKSKEGYDLIRLFCIPPPKNSKRGRATHLTHPEQWNKFKEYCKQDVVAHREVYKKLPNWNYKGFELDLWHIDQIINARGVCMDVELAAAAIRAVDKAQIELKKRTEDLTYGDVSSATKRDQMIKHIMAAYGVELPDMQAGTLERHIDDPNLPWALRELLGIRLQATTSSTAKFKKVMNCVSKDNRLRGTLQWCGASRTGRDGGRLFQPQNLPRPTMENHDIECGIEAMRVDIADLMYDNVMSLASNSLRGLVVAPKGSKLLNADLSNIEGRYAAWLAGEEWKLQAFRDFDKGTGPDLYKLAYAKSFKIKPEQVTKDQRQVGKTLELAMGFGGGVGAFVTFAMNFGSDLEAMAVGAIKSIDKDIMEEAERAWEWAEKEGRTLDLEHDIYVVCDSFKRAWRRAHPNISSFWKQIEDAVRAAIATPKTEFSVKRVKIYRSGNWLRLVMPSGRALCYPHPQVDNKGKISFMGIDQYSRKWQRISTFGGRLFENLVQAGARDVFMRGAVAAETAGYNVTMRIHDELVCEVPDGKEYSVDKLCSFMTTGIDWCTDLPLAAAGHEFYRYRKAD